VQRQGDRQGLGPGRPALEVVHGLPAPGATDVVAERAAAAAFVLGRVDATASA
jgi:hypothetical protein